MKQVFQAEDGTIFEKEIACEKYESKIAYQKSLEDVLIAVGYTEEFTKDFVYDMAEMVTKHCLTDKFINFIKSIGEQDAN
jgi:hypothetical protein